MINKKLLALSIGVAMFSGVAQAVPWCHKGTIVQIADVTWSESQILANFTGSVPGGVYDPERYITFHATHNYANTFAGGGGGFGGYSVPGSGQVRVIPYAPYTYTNMVGPGDYFTSQGISFKLDKCYTIPPLTEHHEVLLPDLGNDGGDGGGIVFDPIEGLEVIKKQWSQPKEGEQR